MPRNTVIMAAVLALGLTACETATPYQPRVPGAHQGGYSEQRLDAEHWRVRFSGNSQTNRSTVEKYLLFRAAELTAQSGYDWFEATDRDTERKTRYYAEPDPFYRTGFGAAYGWGWRPYWSYYRPDGGWRSWEPGIDPYLWTPAYELRVVTRYVATADIVMGKGPRPDGRHAIDARQVIASVGPTVERPKP